MGWVVCVCVCVCPNGALIHRRRHIGNYQNELMLALLDRINVMSLLGLQNLHTHFVWHLSIITIYFSIYLMKSNINKMYTF